MNIYTRMDPYELIGHVGAIPDASELSQALACRLKELLSQVSFYQTENTKLQLSLSEFGKSIALKDNALGDLHKQIGIRDRKIQELKVELENAQDKIAGFMDATAPK